MLASPGPRVPHYNLPLDLPFLFEWVVGSLLTADNEVVIGHTGGTPGKWERVRYDPRGDDLVDSNAAIGIGGKQWRVLPTGTLTGNSILTLNTTNAKLGDTILVTRLDATANTYAVSNGGAGGGTIITFRTNVPAWAEFYYDGTNWIMMKAADIP